MSWTDPMIRGRFGHGSKNPRDMGFALLEIGAYSKNHRHIFTGRRLWISTYLSSLGLGLKGHHFLLLP